MRWVHVLARERLVHFIVLGAAIFALTRDPASQRRISVDPHAEGGGALSGEALTGKIEDEILVREARRLGLDADDDIVRQRLVQKVLFFAEDLGGASRRPTELELRQFFAEHRDRYQAPAQLSFVHVFGATLENAQSFQGPLAALAPESAFDTAPPALGDAFPLSRSVSGRTSDIAGVYGAPFVEALARLEPGVWSAPLASKVGYHLVRVIARTPARPATFEDVAGELPLDYLVAKREEAIQRYLQEAFKRYDVEVDGARMTTLTPTKRVAIHAAGSAED